MARLDWKRGSRFGPDPETNRTFAGMAGWQNVFGDWLTYYRYNADATIIDPIYDETAGNGRQYFPPLRVPALHVTHIQGPNEYGDLGYYTNDTLSAIISFEQFTGVGMQYADVLTGNYLKDRILYNRQVYRVTQISPRGKIQERSITLEIEGQQLKPDELFDDATFTQWADPDPAAGESHG